MRSPVKDVSQESVMLGVRERRTGKKPASNIPKTNRRGIIWVQFVMNPNVIIVAPQRKVMEGRKILGPTFRRMTVAGGWRAT